MHGREVDVAGALDVVVDNAEEVCTAVLPKNPLSKTSKAAWRRPSSQTKRDVQPFCTVEGTTAVGATEGHHACRAVAPQEPLPCSRSPTAVKVHEEVLHRLDIVVHEVAKHYGVKVCLVALDHNGKLHVPAYSGPALNVEPAAVGTKGDFQLFRHPIARNLPIIILDAQKDKRLINNPLVTQDPGIRFYVAAPLVCGRSMRIGTLTIADTAAREGMTLQECHYLEEKAREVVDILSGNGERACGLL